MHKRTAADIETADLLLSGAGLGAGAEDPAVAAGRVYERLARRLSPLVGEAGMRALFARSVKLVKPEFPCLDGVTINTEVPASGDAPTEQLVACLRTVDAAVAAGAAGALYATLLGLLTALIGDHLVQQILKSAFPAIDQNEKETER